MPVPLAPAALVTAFLVFLATESARPLRARRESRLRRLGRNLATAGISAATVVALQTPVLLPIARWAVSHRFGLLGLLSENGFVRVAAGILLLDYTLWLWHRWNHRVRFLWRFHSVHHVDRDMDVSTGLRFHFGELGLSVFYRAAQILVLGTEPLTVAIWQSLLFASVLFHHSNTRLPLGLERVLVRFVVTPRMHGIHHSDFHNETDTNWSSLLSVWDYLHGTILLDVPQGEVTVGVPAFDDPRKVTLGRILALPFRRRNDHDWTRADGTASVRPHPEANRSTLAP